MSLPLWCASPEIFVCLFFACVSVRSLVCVFIYTFMSVSAMIVLVVVDPWRNQERVKTNSSSWAGIITSKHWLCTWTSRTPWLFGLIWMVWSDHVVCLFFGISLMPKKKTTTKHYFYNLAHLITYHLLSNWECDNTHSIHYNWSNLSWCFVETLPEVGLDRVSFRK